MNIARALKRFTDKQPRYVGGIYLPRRRFNEGLGGNSEYIESAEALVDSLASYCDVDATLRVLDFGCGQGRLAQGLLLKAADVGEYCGIDTDKWSIDWCEKWVKGDRTNFVFRHVPAHNARYNRAAQARPPLPVPAGHFNVAFLNSVFSHMLGDDVRFYLDELHDKLQPGGIIYLTAFIETGVPHVEENPAGYLGKYSLGALHRVRYEKGFFFSLVENAGFEIVDFRHRGIERTGQSVVVARKTARASA